MTTYFLLIVLIPASALIVEDVFPARLEECYSGQIDRNTTPFDVQTSCLESFLVDMYNNTSSTGLGKDAFDWLDALGRKLHIRLRRQTHYRLRVRKEIRTLSESEFKNFIDAIKALKSDTSVSPNKYDSFALMHQGGAGKSAHDGPNFVSWHRYFCVLFEEALREYNSRVTLPYWDSRADYLMDNQEDSILFTEIFLGNPKGVVYTGPFAYWSTPTKPSTLLRRELGIKGSPINPERLKAVFRKRYHREILRPTAPDSDHANIESHHDNVHRWVGGNTGHMADIPSSPMDPIFWLHHCFIDYLWEKFRECQNKLGINSETDYPSTTILEHMPNRRMDNLRPQKTNIQGFSNSFTKQIYRYAPAPTCRNNCGGAFNGFLFCDIRKQACVSRSRYEFIGLRGFRRVHYWYPSKEKGKRVTIPRFFMNLNQLLDQQAITSHIGSAQGWVSQIGDGMGAASQIGHGMGASTQIGGGHGGPSQIRERHRGALRIIERHRGASQKRQRHRGASQIGGGLGAASQIEEALGALPDTSAFGAKENSQLTRTSMAPTITRRFRTHFDNPRTRGRRSVDLSLTGNNFKIEFNRNLRLRQEMRKLSSSNSTPYKFDNLAMSQIAIINKHKGTRNSGQDKNKNQRTFNITFQTDGFSYSGRHLDYISIDEHTLLSESFGLIVFEKPVSGETKVYVRAYNSDGELCQPSCLVSKSTYKECSGLIKITSNFPRMYVDSYNDAFDSEITPFLKFVCVN